MKNSRMLSKNSSNFAKSSIIRQLWVGVICRKMAKKQAWIVVEVVLTFDPHSEMVFLLMRAVIDSSGNPSRTSSDTTWIFSSSADIIAFVFFLDTSSEISMVAVVTILTIPNHVLIQTSDLRKWVDIISAMALQFLYMFKWKSCIPCLGQKPNTRNQRRQNLLNLLNKYPNTIQKDWSKLGSFFFHFPLIHFPFTCTLRPAC